jgi:hypothetical protein
MLTVCRVKQAEYLRKSLFNGEKSMCTDDDYRLEQEREFEREEYFKRLERKFDCWRENHV